MKHILPILITLFILVPAAQADGPPRGTADYYKLTPEKFNNKQITLYVSAVSQWSYEGSDVPPGFRPAWFSTAAGGESGGMIKALISEKRYASIVRNYGSKIELNNNYKIKSKRLNCLFYQMDLKSGGRTWIVVVR